MTDKVIRALVAEDNSAMADVIRYSLEKAGCQVVVAHSGQVAWDLLQDQDFQLLISDFQMPGLTGGELCERMRKEPRLAGVPVVLLTAKSLELDSDHYLNDLSVSAIVSKPFSPRQLTTIVHDCLNGSKARV